MNSKRISFRPIFQCGFNVASPALTSGLIQLIAMVMMLLTSSGVAQAQWHKANQDIMGTRITVELFHENDAVAERAIKSVMAEMHRIDRAMSPYKVNSELSRVNREASQQPLTISDELFDLLQRSIEFSQLTNGAFDITFASVGFLYDYRAHIKPDAATLKEATRHINYRQIQLNANTHTVFFSQPGVKIDLGGIAKGYAVDQGIRLIQAMGISHGLITAGGDTRVIGDRWGRPWQIGIRDPRQPEGIIARIPLENVAVSTSGDYERFFEVDNIRYHHIINPTTGDSARELQSATLIGPDALTTDALSTSVFVLGVSRGLALVNRLDSIDAIVVDSQGQMHYSAELQRIESHE